MVKIGQTAHTAAKRAKELAREYGAADAFEVASKHATPDAEAVERIAHRMLADCRQPRSELFACSPKVAASVIRAAVQSYERPWAVTVWLLLAALVAGVTAFRPVMPSWLPLSVVRAATALERLR